MKHLKRISIDLVLFALISCITLTSCGAEHGDSYGIVSDFLDGYGVACRVYTSLAKEGESEYIDEDMRKQLFTNYEFSALDYTLAIHSRLDFLFELFVFRTSDATAREMISEMCFIRAKMLSRSTDGEGRVLIEDDLVIYIFSNDIDGAYSRIMRVL